VLDLTKLARQLPGISQHLHAEAAASRQRLDRAGGLLRDAEARRTELRALQERWGDRLAFTAAVPLEPLDTRVLLAAPPERHSVFATDGSQISPSHHEIAYCYLLNIGRVAIHYGQSRYPLLDSVPEVYYRPEDLYVSRQWGIRTEEWLGYQRTVSEQIALAELACRWVNPPGAHPGPNLAVVDGSLLFWFLESLPTDARDRLLPPILSAWEQLRASRIPLVGYISASRSSEATNFLRLQACPYPAPDCPTHCSEIAGNLPCQLVDPLRDATLWQQRLAPGERGPLWRSSARILECYDDPAQICFCYVHVGSEVARVEMPQWVVDDPELRDRALGIVLAQVHKGYGYPVALAEAHNQAVVRGGDRARFFALLEQQLVRSGLRDVGTSSKEARKRGSIA